MDCQEESSKPALQVKGGVKHGKLGGKRPISVETDRVDPQVL